MIIYLWVFCLNNFVYISLLRVCQSLVLFSIAFVKTGLNFLFVLGCIVGKNKIRQSSWVRSGCKRCQCIAGNLKCWFGCTGMCPAVNATTSVSVGEGTCTNSCYSDKECTGRQRCCSNGCGRQCSTPVGELICTHFSYIFM